ncbi:helix-turn-helix transcriptional regulator [Pelagibius sp. CAU 1746]|uniref:helix-turn-helix domain-containing protein n=1 Tax=Pelagibius sp. CAU 1746 TaxID=3140370 RepID=UPI00325ABC3A
MSKEKTEEIKQSRQKPLRTPGHIAVRKYLKEARQYAGITQESLAARLGWRQGDVSKVEIGERRLDVVELIQVAREVGFDPCDLVNAVDKAVPKSGKKRQARKRPAP